MNRPKWFARAKTALKVYRYGFEQKRLPWPWPSWRQLQPLWHLIDLQTYVNEGFALNSLVYSAIMFKVRAMMTAPLRAYTGDPSYPELLPANHPLARLVARPNEHQSWTEFHSQNMVYLNLDGNAFIYKSRSDRTMYSLRPDKVFIIPAKGRVSKLKGYVYVPEGASPYDGFPIIPEDMIHIKLPNPGDELEGMGYGLSPLSAAAQSVDTDNLVTKFLNVFFQRGTMLTGILSFDIPLKEGTVDKILARWKEKYGGVDKWGVGVLDRGGKYQRTGLTFDEMGFSEQDARNECRILGPFGVPPILIGSRIGLERSTYSNYEGARKAVWEDTLVPELKMFETEFQYHLKGRKAFVQYDLSQVPALQKDVPVLASAAFTFFQMGVPANQALKAVGLRIGDVAGGDLPFAGRQPPASNAQGPRSDADADSWGMRSLLSSLDLKCELCNGTLKAFQGTSDLLRCPYCDELYVLGSNGHYRLSKEMVCTNLK